VSQNIRIDSQLPKGKRQRRMVGNGGERMCGRNGAFQLAYIMWEWMHVECCPTEKTTSNTTVHCYGDGIVFTGVLDETRNGGLGNTLHIQLQINGEQTTQ